MVFGLHYKYKTCPWAESVDVYSLEIKNGVLTALFRNDGNKIDLTLDDLGFIKVEPKVAKVERQDCCPCCEQPYSEKIRHK